MVSVICGVVARSASWIGLREAQRKMSLECLVRKELFRYALLVGAVLSSSLCTFVADPVCVWRQHNIPLVSLVVSQKAGMRDLWNVRKRTSVDASSLIVFFRNSVA